ncbi:MAG TPA: tetratricopeptide repeat protein [Nitrospirota bacterium]|nr:tetratricopeptide repeat protein [Nitrospirota bacterium]
MNRRLLRILLILCASSVQSSALAGPSLPPAYVKAERMFASGKYTDALLFYKQALANRTGKVARGDIQSRIGDCFFRLQDYGNARNAYRSALQQQKLSQRPPTQYWIGFCAFLLGKDQEAIAEFLKIPKLYPSSGIWVGTAYYWAGRAGDRMGQKELAEEYYRRAGGKGKFSYEQFALKKAEEVKKSKQ